MPVRKYRTLEPPVLHVSHRVRAIGTTRSTHAAIGHCGNDTRAKKRQRILDAKLFDDDLRNLQVMYVRGEDLQTVLHGARSNPDIIGGDRRPSFPKRIQDDRVPGRRALVDINELHTRRRKELVELTLILPSTFAFAETGKQFTEHDWI